MLLIGFPAQARADAESGWRAYLAGDSVHARHGIASEKSLLVLERHTTVAHGMPGDVDDLRPAGHHQCFPIYIGRDINHRGDSHRLVSDEMGEVREDGRLPDRGLGRWRDAI